jgi:hypothetical protein
MGLTVLFWARQILDEKKEGEPSSLLSFCVIRSYDYIAD